MNYQNCELFGKHRRQRRTQFVHCPQGPKDQSDNCCRDTLQILHNPEKRKNHRTVENHVVINVPDRTTLRENQPHIDTHWEQTNISHVVERSAEQNIPGCPARSRG